MIEHCPGRWVGESILICRMHPLEAAMNLSVANDVAPLVLERRQGAVAFLTLNRPAQYNALSEEMLAALERRLNALGTDATARVVVLGGAGKAFCAGHDLKQMKSKPDLAYYRRLFGDCSRLMMRIQSLPQP